MVIPVNQNNSIIASVNASSACTVNVKGFYYVESNGRWDQVPFGASYVITSSQATGAKIVLDTFVCPVGYLLSLTISLSTPNLQRGQVFGRADIVFTNTTIPYYVLFADYVTSGQAIGFPFSQIKSSTEGKGYERVVPADAGNAFTPSNVLWHIRYITLSVSSSTTQDRYAVWIEGLSGFRYNFLSSQIPENSRAFITFAEGLQMSSRQLVQNSQQFIICENLPKIFLSSLNGDSFKVVSDLGVALTMSSIYCGVEELIET